MPKGIAVETGVLAARRILLLERRDGAAICGERLGERDAAVEEAAQLTLRHVLGVDARGGLPLQAQHGVSAELQRLRQDRTRQKRPLRGGEEGERAPRGLRLGHFHEHRVASYGRRLEDRPGAFDVQRGQVDRHKPKALGQGVGEAACVNGDALHLQPSMMSFTHGAGSVQVLRCLPR